MRDVSSDVARALSQLDGVEVLQVRYVLMLPPNRHHECRLLSLGSRIRSPRETSPDHGRRCFPPLDTLFAAQGDVTDSTSVHAAMNGCNKCIACFGAARIARLSDLWTNPSLHDPSHPRAVNYQGVVNLVQVRRLPGMSPSKLCFRIFKSCTNSVTLVVTQLHLSFTSHVLHPCPHRLPKRLPTSRK